MSIIVNRTQLWGYLLYEHISTQEAGTAQQTRQTRLCPSPWHCLFAEAEHSEPSLLLLMQGQHCKRKLVRGLQHPTKRIFYWWSLRFHREFSSCTHSSPAEFASKIPRSSSNTSLPNKALTYKPIHWRPLWDLTRPLLTHLSGGFGYHWGHHLECYSLSCCPSQFGITAWEIFSLCCCRATGQFPPGSKPTHDDAIIKLTFHDGIHGNISKTDKCSLKTGWARRDLACQPHPTLLKKKSRRKEKGRKGWMGKEKEMSWILFKNL